MHIFFDLDRTLVDITGDHLRPCMKHLLKSFNENAITVSLWTSATEEVTHEILVRHDIKKYFTNIICREDYDPLCEGYPKDIGKYGGDYLVDDNADHIEFVKLTGKDGYLITPYIVGNLEYLSELEEINRMVLPEVKIFDSKGLLKGCGCLDG